VAAVNKNHIIELVNHTVGFYKVRHLPKTTLAKFWDFGLKNICRAATVFGLGSKKLAITDQNFLETNKNFWKNDNLQKRNYGGQS